MDTQYDSIVKLGDHVASDNAHNESNRSLDKERPLSRIEQRIRAEIAELDTYIDDIEDDITTLQKHMLKMADKRAKLLAKLEQSQAQGAISTGGKGQKMGDGDVTFDQNDSLEKRSQQGQQGIMDQKGFKMIQEGDNEVMVLSDSD